MSTIFCRARSGVMKLTRQHGTFYSQFLHRLLPLLPDEGTFLAEYRLFKDWIDLQTSRFSTVQLRFRNLLTLTESISHHCGENE